MNGVADFPLPLFLIQYFVKGSLRTGLSKDQAKSLFEWKITGKPEGEYAFEHALIDQSISLQEDKLPVERLSSVLIFPWMDWQLFQVMDQRSMLKHNEKLNSLPVSRAVKAYDQLFSEIKSDSHTIRIESLKQHIQREGYKNIIPLGMTFECDHKDILYNSGGHHRIIAYQDLLSKNSVKPSLIDCVFIEVQNLKESYQKIGAVGVI